MATAKKLASGSWRCQVYSHTEEILQPDGSIKQKRIYKSFSCDDPSPKGKRKCEKEAATWAAEKEKFIPKSNNMTFRAALNDYIERRTQVLSPATIREYKGIRNRSLQSIMDIPVYSLTQEMIQSAINQEALSHAPKTVRNCHGLISAVLNTYRPDFVLKTDLPKKIRPDLYVPTDSDIQRLMQEIRGTDMELPVLLAAFGPMRRGEICALNTDSITGTIVHVHRNMVLDENNNWIIKQPKSYAGDRYIDYPDFVAEKWKGISGSITELCPSKITNRFVDIVKRADLPHFRFHDLRHYSASIQHALGIPDSYIMQRGGWGNDGVLKAVYRHTMKDKVSKMNQIANNYFTELCNTSCNTNRKNP